MSTTQQPSLTETTKNLVKPDSLTVQQLPTPCPSSGSVTPEPGEQPDETMPIKRKKKKKSKKNAKAKTTTAEQLVQNTAQPALRISRNKHWRYISSYHGPWLQLPIELLDSLLILNMDPATLSTPEPRTSLLPSPSDARLPGTFSPRIHERGYTDRSFTETLHNAFMSSAPPLPLPRPGQAMPPPIDPGVFRSVTTIRRLVDEASELSVRARSGTSRNQTHASWGSASGYGFNNPMMNDFSHNNGRNVNISPTRIHRLRTLAVQKLAEAYKIDEIAASVMVMQNGTVFDDIAERVLKVDPHDVDARYVHFFHEKIPSRHLAESTTTQVLDSLIIQYPHRLEFYRTRGIVHCFRDQYSAANRDFTFALKEARAQRKARTMQRIASNRAGTHGRRSKRSKARKNGQAPENGTGTLSADDRDLEEVDDSSALTLHPSVLSDAPDPIEPQCLFLRGAAYLAHAAHIIENAIIDLEGIERGPLSDGSDLRLCYIPGGRYGGVEIGNTEGPLGERDGIKAQAYRAALAEPNFREQVYSLLLKCMRDHERFLSMFDSLEATGPPFPGNIAEQVDAAHGLCDRRRPSGTSSNHGGTNTPTHILPSSPTPFTSYHPLLVEAHFSLLLCRLLLGDITGLLPAFARTAAFVDGFEGYPIFLPARSMAQAEFLEILDRLAGGWKKGVRPHSLAHVPNSLVRHGKGAERHTAPPLLPLPELSFRDLRDTLHDIAGPSGPSSAVSSSSSSSTTLLGVPPGISRQTSRMSAASVDVGATSIVNPRESLDGMRMLLGPVARRLREKAERLANERRLARQQQEVPQMSKPLNIPLHGPRVEVFMAWLGAVHLPEMDDAAA